MQIFQQTINQLLAQQKYTLAEKKIKANLKGQPKNPEFIRLLGIVQLHQNKFSLAEKCFNRVLAIDNKYTPAMTNLAYIKQQKGNYIEAHQWLQKSLRLNPGSVETNHQLGIVNNLLNNFEQAEFYFKQALIINPNHNASRLNLAVLLKNKGEIDSAITHLHHSLSINPLQPQVYWLLANLKSYQFDQSEKDMVGLLLSKVTDHKDKEALLFTQAKILESENKYSESFTVLKQANDLKHEGLKRNSVDWPSLLDAIKEVFTAEYVARHQNQQKMAVTPVLIAGMPRSGSTLIEQILASHSKITGASELNYLTDLVDKVPQGYPYGFKQYQQKDYQQLADNYLALTANWSKHTSYFTDKMPGNINYAGVLLLAIPNARLIHTRRNPMDVCLSVYKQNFENRNNYSYNLNELVSYYKFQELLAEYWQILFPERVISVNYEQVIEYTEQEVRSMLSFLDLEFESDCLEFYRTKRHIRTASAGQVTQKIYKTATNYYKNYGDSLNQLADLLNQPFVSE